jgi:cold shock protein
VKLKPERTTPIRGEVKIFNSIKGYGFIAVGTGQPDVFVHVSQIDGGEYLEKGDRVKFETGPNVLRYLLFQLVLNLQFNVYPEFSPRSPGKYHSSGLPNAYECAS